MVQTCVDGEGGRGLSRLLLTLRGCCFLFAQCEDDGPMSNGLHPHGSGSAASDVTSDYFSYHDSNGFTLADTFVNNFHLAVVKMSFNFLGDSPGS
jgi:hypothetical protein